MTLTALICYGLALPVPHLGCIMAWIVLCQGKPLPLKKGIITGFLLLFILAGGILMVPLLEHYPFPSVLLTALFLYVFVMAGLKGKGAQSTLLTISVAIIPVAGLIEQALAVSIAIMMGVGFIIGAAVNYLAVVLLPSAPTPASPENMVPVFPHQQALIAVIIIIPVWMMALNDPALCIPAVMKTVMLAQQASSGMARKAGSGLVESTLVGALLSFILWCGLSIWPSLLMLALWLGLLGAWVARRMVQLSVSSRPPAFWGDVWVTCLILAGPAIQDSASGDDVWRAAAVRCALYIAVALYGWLCLSFLRSVTAGKEEMG